MLVQLFLQHGDVWQFVGAVTHSSEGIVVQSIVIP